MLTISRILRTLVQMEELGQRKLSIICCTKRLQMSQATEGSRLAVCFIVWELSKAEAKYRTKCDKEYFLRLRSTHVKII